MLCMYTTEKEVSLRMVKPTHEKVGVIRDTMWGSGELLPFCGNWDQTELNSQIWKHMHTAMQDSAVQPTSQMGKKVRHTAGLTQHLSSCIPLEQHLGDSQRMNQKRQDEHLTNKNLTDCKKSKQLRELYSAFLWSLQCHWNSNLFTLPIGIKSPLHLPFYTTAVYLRIFQKAQMKKMLSSDASLSKI